MTPLPSLKPEGIVAAHKAIVEASGMACTDFETGLAAIRAYLAATLPSPAEDVAALEAKVKRQASLLGEQAYRLRCLRAEVRRYQSGDRYTTNWPFTYKGMIHQNEINYAKFKAAGASASSAIEERDRLKSALFMIAHTFTEDSHGGTKCLPGSDYQRMARAAITGGKDGK